ncbi:unnamed protein product [Ilex paraguariensis]|uniref:Uncharacterized protein n=1 Tax=Ilex paraguariensis TaxID=185542 RepID=A0ABC8SCX1_9AQUA
MDEFGGPRFDVIVNTIRKKRSQTSRRPRPEPQPFPESCDRSPSSLTPPSDDVSKVSSDENTGCDANSKRKVFNLNQCASRGFYTTKTEGEYHKKIKNEDGGSNVSYGNGGLGDGFGNDNKLKKLKLKVGGVTRTIQTTHSASGSGSSTKSARSANGPRSRQKLIIQDYSDEDHSPTLDRKSGLQGLPWKNFSRGGIGLGKEDSLMGKNSGKNVSEKRGEKLDPVRKSKRVPKRRVLQGAFEEDDEDDEIRYLEKLKTSKAASGYKDFEEESTKKQRSLSRVSKGGKSENLEDFGSVRSVKDGKKSRSERVTDDTDYEEEELLSDGEPEGMKTKKQREDPSDSPTESKREMTLTTRQRALLSGKDASSASGASQIEFPNGLPPPPPRKQKEKLSEVEQQLKKVEAAQRRRVQNEKAARESEVCLLLIYVLCYLVFLLWK